MIENSKVVFITHPYFAVNNPTNNLRIYFKKAHSDKWHYIQCNSKEEYRHKIKEYILGFFEYSRNEEKAYSDVKEYINTFNDSNLFDYFMGGKKDEQVMLDNQMRREKMAQLKTGKFLTDRDVPSMQKRWSNYIEDSNIQMTVLSFYQDYVDENIDIHNLQAKISTDIMPKFLSYCGYEDPMKNLEWVVSLHNDRENNYHFHISWIERNKCYRNKKGELEHRIQLKLSDDEINFLKRQTSLTIERNKLYKPALIKLNKDIKEFQSFFNPKSFNFCIKNYNDLQFEEKIIRLGFLLNKVRSDKRKYIKYNSLPKDETGKNIRKLATEIKRELFKLPEIKVLKKQIYQSIDNINNILIDIDKRNNISKVGFQNILENKLIKEKLERTDSYVLNAIVNHALYNIEYYTKRLKKNNLNINIYDIISEVSVYAYKQEFSELKNKPIKNFKKKLLLNFFNNKNYKPKMIKALESLDYNQRQAEELFKELFVEEKDITFKSL